MALLLSIDTSTTVCSVALHQVSSPTSARLLGCYELFTERTSSAMLTTLVGNVVEHAGVTLRQLDAVAVAKGPGSYTGLRIGVSTAKGLCFALDKPLLAVNTLRAMTEQLRPHYVAATRFCPMIDARRMEVYCALYNADGQEQMATSALVVDEQAFRTELDAGPVLFFGDGAAKCRPLLSAHPNARFLDDVVQPSARTVGTLAAAHYVAGQFEDLARFEPFYLKDFVGTKPKKAVV